MGKAYFTGKCMNQSLMCRKVGTRGSEAAWADSAVLLELDGVIVSLCKYGVPPGSYRRLSPLNPALGLNLRLLQTPKHERTDLGSVSFCVLIHFLFPVRVYCSSGVIRSILI